MNKNEECEIVKDLSSLHIDNMLSEKSKIFIERHLKSCTDCNKYYNDLTSTFLNETKNEKNNDTIEINHLKKFNKKITILKWLLTGLIVLILIIIFSLYFKICYIDGINDITISKILDMQKNSNNYKLTRIITQINRSTNEKNVIKTEHYYKDGKHKEIISSNQTGTLQEESLRFIEDNKYEKTTVFHSLKQIDHQIQNFIEESKGKYLDLIISRVMLNDAGIHRLGLKTRTEVYDNKECYIVSDSYNGAYRDNYIDKESGDLIRIVSNSENFYEEEVFILEENIVTDDDVDISILENDKKYDDYKINNINYEIDETFREFYE